MDIRFSGAYWPIKMLEKKRWHNHHCKNICYPKRIQKKWTKKHGLEWIEVQKPGQFIIDELNGIILCRKDDFEKLKKATDAQKPKSPFPFSTMRNAGYLL